MGEQPLGQVAYEAYCGKTDWKSLISGAPLPQWEEVTARYTSCYGMLLLMLVIKKNDDLTNSRELKI